MLHIFQVETDEHKLQTRALLREYLEWLRASMNRDYGLDLDFDPDVMVEQAMLEDSKFSPPSGRLLLAHENDEPAGLVCLRKIAADTGEVKRMYVRPIFRGKGVGMLLVDHIREEARQIGYARLRLDSAPFMKSAHAVYHSAGFHDIEPYPESDVPPEFHANWLFMELTL